MFFLLTITPVQHCCGSGLDLLIPEEDLKSGRGVWMRLQSHSTYPTKQIQNSQCKHKFKSFPNPMFLHKTILPHNLTRYFYTYFCKQIFTNFLIINSCQCSKIPADHHSISWKASVCNKVL